MNQSIPIWTELQRPGECGPGPLLHESDLLLRSVMFFGRQSKPRASNAGYLDGCRITGDVVHFAAWPMYPNHGVLGSDVAVLGVDSA
jgi:hypothetical protein